MSDFVNDIFGRKLVSPVGNSFMDVVLVIVRLLENTCRNIPQLPTELAFTEEVLEVLC